MKHSMCLFSILALVLSSLAWPQTASAQLASLDLAKQLNFEITATKKKLEAKHSDTASEHISTEKWAYSVTIVNSTMADQSDLQVDYRTYMRDDAENRPDSPSKLPLRKQPGSETVSALLNGKSFTFITKEMTLNSNILKGGWVHDNGSKRAVVDSLYGVWVRISKGGVVVAEYTNPDSLKTKAKWD